MTSSESHILSTLTQEYLIRSEHPGFRQRFGDHFIYAFPSVRAGFSKVNPKGAEPNEFIEFARRDLLQGGESGFINAVGHAKRAVHLSIESLVQLLCLTRFARKSNFPKLLDVFENLGAFPTRLMATLNRRRNVVEHEYETPSDTEARDFVEMAELFVSLCYGFLRGTVIGAYVGDAATGECREYAIDPASYTIKISSVAAGSSLTTADGRIHYNILKTTPRTIVQEFPLDAANEALWLPALRLLVYCTVSDTFRLSDIAAPGEIVPTHSELEVVSERDERGRVVVRTSKSTSAPLRHVER